MGEDIEGENRATPRLQLLYSLPSLRSPDHPSSGAMTPPLETHASVPFLWEAEPGKPKPYTTLALPSGSNPTPTKSLDLPPRLLNEAKFTKTPSPTTVLEGPYTSLGRSLLESSSLRFLRKRHGSFDGALSLGGSGGSSPDRGLLGTVVLTSSGSCRKDLKGLFGSWRKRGAISLKSTKSEGSFVISSLSDDVAGDFCGGGSSGKVARMSRKRSLSSAKSHFWANIYGAFKQIIPKRSTKWKKDAL